MSESVGGPRDHLANERTQPWLLLAVAAAAIVGLVGT